MTLVEEPSLLASDKIQYTNKRVNLQSLTLNSFRNYTYARIEVNSGPIVLTGSNGAGKTTVLEAISLLSPGRGIRRAKLSELNSSIASGQPWAISANAEGLLGKVKIGTGRDIESVDTDKRIIRIDGKSSRGQADLTRHISIIWLVPTMEQLFQESASAGRKFLDRLVYSFDPDHAGRVNEYEYAMRERNKLLSNGCFDTTWLDALEQTMVETGGAIAQARLQTIEHINDAIQRSPLSFPKAHLSMAGIVEDKLAAGHSSIFVEDEFKHVLKSNRHLDAASGRTLLGIHRSEMNVIHIIKQMPASCCSTGEQKALLLSIILAQARAGVQWHGVIPVLLLDEVIAHLDATRRLELFEEICQIGAQTWMTGTDAELFAGLEGKAQYLKVDNGKIF